VRKPSLRFCAWTFTVYSRGGHPDRYGGDDTFKVWDAGVLEVATGGGIVIYGPSGWLRIDVAPHQSDRPSFFGGMLK
jgi:hypothetical protein